MEEKEWFENVFMKDRSKVLESSSLSELKKKVNERLELLEKIGIDSQNLRDYRKARDHLNKPEII